jgi:hypothetical protein
MVNASRLVVVARFVRLGVAVCVAALALGYVAVACFAHSSGAETPVALDSISNDPALSAAVRTQEARGLVCSEKPELTDVILFQRAGADDVAVLTFDEAITAAGAREGWIRRYCT